MAPSIPSAAWVRRFDEKLDTPGVASSSMTLPMIVKMLPVAWRLMAQMRRQSRQGFDPINLFNPPRPGPTQGVPLGGIGSGTIGRGWKGEFRRWQMRPGFVHHDVIPVDAFSVRVQKAGQEPQATVLLTEKPQDGSLSAWNWSLDESKAQISALYPRAWLEYDRPVADVRLTCRQVSPIIPHNYRESSYPVGVFVWQIENLAAQAQQVSLMFTFQNGVGGAGAHAKGAKKKAALTNDQAGGHSNRPFVQTGVHGVELRHIHRQNKVNLEGSQSIQTATRFEDPLNFAIAAWGGEVSCVTRFDPTGDGSQLWDDFMQDGRLDNPVDDRPSAVGETIAAALAVTVDLQPGEQREVVFSLAWDMPRVRSGVGTPYYRRYTQFYGCDGLAAPRMAVEAIRSYAAWEEQIEAWQDPVLNDAELPEWYKMALFNELYYIADGGTLWCYPAQSAALSEAEMGHFAYLEGHEYPMYNTYDVHFYASIALAMLWPEIELSIQRDFADTVLLDLPEIRSMVFTGHKAPRKVRGAIPHDLGWPSEDTWVLVNGYFFHNTNDWKDLNPKFVLQVYRDYSMTGRLDFLQYTWPAVQEAMAYMDRFDTDRDGLIENSGFPDQTYDTWTVTGPSAYTGALWLASLSAAAAMADALSQPDQAAAYRATLAKGTAAYEAKLWNGRYYNYDSSRSKHHDSIMADMLCGQWFALAAGLPPVVSMEHTRQALQTVFEYNVLKFQDGSMGAVNGMRPDGSLDRTNLQSQEVWVGTTYALAAGMLQVGLDEAAWKTARGLVDCTYRRFGYWFQTPEAWDSKGNFRSAAYMRPLAIWALQWELERRRR